MTAPKLLTVAEARIALVAAEVKAGARAFRDDAVSLDRALDALIAAVKREAFEEAVRAADAEAAEAKSHWKDDETVVSWAHAAAAGAAEDVAGRIRRLATKVSS